MAGTATAPTGSPTNRLWNRELEHYPAAGPRVVNLTIVVLATIVLYYQFYLAGAVATRIIAEFHMSFAYYVNISVIGYVLGAVASFAAGFADRYGRANIVTIGLLLTGLLCLFAIPNAHSKVTFAIAFIAVAFVEGVILVATPALIRDFSPQLGRASAMGFWTLGPVLGSLVVSVVVSTSSDSRPWQDQFMVCGIVGLVIFVIAAVGLRELTPGLRDQLMVSTRDRALIEAKAKGIDIEASLRKPFRQMLKPDIVGSAFAISVFLIIYYLAVGFFPVFFQTVFGYSQSKANGLGNWFWAFNALALLITGFVSDLVRVRKPFMLVGAIGAIVFTVIFATKATQPDTSYSTFVILLILLSAFLGVAYAPWMASFTETAERRNPALAATGLAVWGLVIRIVIAVAVFFVPFVVNTVTTLVDTGPTVQEMVAGADPSLTAAENATVKAVAADPTIATKTQSLAAQYQPQLATAAKLKPATLTALTANPTDPATQADAISQISGSSVADVAKVRALGAQYVDQLTTAAAIDQSTRLALLANPADPASQAKAVGEIASGRHLAPADAIAKLQALAQVPTADLIYLNTAAPPVQKAAADLTALGAVPAADFAYLATNGPALQDPKVQDALKFLQANAPGVLAAAHDSPKQWQTYFWIAVGGEVVFIPFIFLMVGFWSPRKAKKHQDEHEAMVAAELARFNT
ncbi:MAG: major facilitator superfamily 1 [Amycolatopsis sp.]|uniref:MFS transporter n=1 Tax=Amycolatopsis sp. TaxID=37632 RepID=UPI00261860BC|nr:MFS transporter [Amycolatopsis sp.]MCU1681036.1 major facilitator superfamily 1 [Amycolatopsis sp.]